MKIKDYQLFIGGEWVDPSTGAGFTVINPATDETICKVAEGGVKDVDRAAAAARKALTSPPWATMTPSDRGRLLWKIADLLEKNIDEFAALETLNNGKTLFESRQAEMPMGVDVLRYYAGWTTKIAGETLASAPNTFIYTLREPVGVVGAITPWNFPLLLALWKIAPALACGNVVVHKPASWTPLTALRFAEICQEAGLPPGVLNVVPGPGGSVGEALVKHPGVDKISFTGETSTGKHIMKLAADGLKRVSLELGGKSPNIVFADSDLDAASRGSYNAVFYNKGEVCCAGSRLFVEQSAYDPLMAKLTDRVKKCTVGDPFDKNTRMGPVVHRKQLERILEYVEAGKREGARLTMGGRRVGLKGAFCEPTIFEGVTPEMKIAREEIFGPVLSVIPFKDFNDVIAASNDTFYGLAAGIWTHDVKKAHKAARALRAGTVWVNCYGFFDACAPFGGYKASGFGRELGAAALDLYTELKTVWIDLSS